MKSKKIQLIVVALVVIIGALFASGIFKQKDTAKKVASPAKVPSAEWQLRQIGDTGLSVIMTPNMRQMPIKLDEKAKEILSQYDAFEYKDGSFEIRISHIISIHEIQANSYAEKLVQMFKGMKDLTDYKSTISPVTIDDIDGVFIKSSTIKKGAAININSVIAAKGLHVWDVSITFDSANKEQKELAKKILGSVDIK